MTESPLPRSFSLLRIVARVVRFVGGLRNRLNPLLLPSSRGGGRNVLGFDRQIGAANQILFLVPFSALPARFDGSRQARLLLPIRQGRRSLLLHQARWRWLRRRKKQEADTNRAHGFPGSSLLPSLAFFSPNLTRRSAYVVAAMRAVTRIL